MQTRIQSAIQGSALSNAIKSARVAISQIALSALLPTEVPNYKTRATTGVLGVTVHPAEIVEKCEPLAANRKPVYQMLVE